MHKERFNPLEYYNLTRELARYNKERLEPGSTIGQHPREIEYVEAIRETVQTDLQGIDLTVAWYDQLLHYGPGQGDPLFPWLAGEATMEQMQWFLSQEAAGEAGFGDLTAMTQVRMPNRAKLEMARNYWDEMGNGREEAMHDKLLRDLAQKVGAHYSVEDTVPESLQLANILTAFAVHRRYAYHSVGALGVIEMTAPGRVALVDEGLARLGVSSEDRRYFTLHATLDIKHSREWNNEVIVSLGNDHIKDICEGAYIRLWMGARCFARYRQEFGLGSRVHYPLLHESNQQ